MIMNNKELIEYQYKCLCSDIPFADFDQMCRCYISILNKNSQFYYSSFAMSVVNEIKSTHISANIVNDYLNNEYALSRIEQIKNAVCDFWNISIKLKTYIVDDLPGSFPLSSWKAMYVDEEQSMVFHISEGLYYKRKFITPILFELIICHEMIHLVLYNISDHFRTIKSSALEEGICDFFSYLILTQYRIITDYHCLKKFILSNRSLCSNTNPIRYTYWAYSFKVFVVFSMINKNEFIKRYIINGENLDCFVIPSQKNTNTEDLSLISSIFYDSASKLVISEKEYCVFKNINNLKRYIDALKDSGLEQPEFQSILDSLEKKWILCKYNDLIINNVSSKDVFFYLSDGVEL